MKYLFIFILLSHVLKQTISFEIDIEHCLASNGKEGFCRLKAHCHEKMTGIEKQCANKEYVCCANSGKSYEMCLKYAEEVYQHMDSGIVLPFRDEESTKTSQCGITATPLIIGGEEAKPMEFPHMALIGFGTSKTSVSWLCGGSLISEKYVLTAAHCLSAGRRGPAKWVRLGIVNVDSTIFEESQEIEVEEKISYPRYKGRVNDIALLKLKKNATFSPYVRPACLDDIGVLTASTGIATGWGKTEHKLRHKKYLMKVQLDIIDKPTCTKGYKRNIFMPQGIEDTMMCAGVLSGGKDTCHGDSGGPLQIILENPYCMYRIIGVISFGIDCGMANSPAIYTRVFAFLPWIESIVWQDE